MPQVDLETLVSACAGGGSMDRKVACEPQPEADQDRPEDKTTAADDDIDEEILPPDFPPESFWLSKDAEYDWFDRNAFFERKDSTKGANSSTNLNPNSNNNSQRFSMNNLKSKAAIIGLPKPQKPNYADNKNRRHCKAGGRLFPKRSGSLGKSTDGSMIEPSSPKVSCMGRVRSKRDRKRRWRNHRQRSSAESSMEKTIKTAERRKPGLLASFRAMFRHGRRDKSKIEAHAAYAEVESPPRRSSATRRSRKFDFETASCDSLPRQSTDGEPPALGGMKRFVSGRRSGSWVGENGIDVA